MDLTITNSFTLSIAQTEEERNDAIRLLMLQNLPVQDLNNDKLLYLLSYEGRIIGTAGLEIFDDCGLLRSVSVIKEEQGNGYGRFLNTKMEGYAKESGVDCLYLLTTTASSFFEKQGFCLIKREDAPLPIQQTTEFSSLCPSSAVVMKKRL